jgi:hypothetical protein
METIIEAPIKVAAFGLGQPNLPTIRLWASKAALGLVVTGVLLVSDTFTLPTVITGHRHDNIGVCRLHMALDYVFIGFCSILSPGTLVHILPRSPICTLPTTHGKATYIWTCIDATRNMVSWT